VADIHARTRKTIAVRIEMFALIQTSLVSWETFLVTTIGLGKNADLDILSNPAPTNLFRQPSTRKKCLPQTKTLAFVTNILTGTRSGPPVG